MEGCEIFQLFLILMGEDKLEKFQEVDISNRMVSKYLEEVKQEKGINAMLDVEELIMKYGSDYELQGFINGFRYAMKLKEDCVV